MADNHEAERLAALEQRVSDIDDAARERDRSLEKTADERWTIWQDWHDKIVGMVLRLSNRTWAIAAAIISVILVQFVKPIAKELFSIFQ